MQADIMSFFVTEVLGVYDVSETIGCTILAGWFALMVLIAAYRIRGSLPLILLPYLVANAALYYLIHNRSEPELRFIIDTLNDPFQITASILPLVGLGILVSICALSDRWSLACSVAFYAQFITATAMRMLTVITAPRTSLSLSGTQLFEWMVFECAIMVLFVFGDRNPETVERLVRMGLDRCDDIRVSHIQLPMYVAMCERLTAQQGSCPDCKACAKHSSSPKETTLDSDTFSEKDFTKEERTVLPRTWRTDVLVISKVALGLSILRCLCVRYLYGSTISPPTSLEALTLLLAMSCVQWTVASGIVDELKKEMDRVYLP
jgi:hypothetical protein